MHFERKLILGHGESPVEVRFQVGLNAGARKLQLGPLQMGSVGQSLDRTVTGD